MSTTNSSLRAPRFMGRTRSHSQAQVAVAFPAAGNDGVPSSDWSASGAAEPEPLAPAAVPAAIVFPPVEASPAQAVVFERQVAEMGARVERAVERLRTTGERLAAEARADALEVALAVARRIVEAELTVNLEGQVTFIRTALRRLGESRTVTVRMAPAQAATLQGDVDRAGSEAGLRAATTARLDIVADPTLAPGDCVVDGDLASVDGRITTRLEEVRRAVLAAVGEEQP